MKSVSGNSIHARDNFHTPLQSIAIYQLLRSLPLFSGIDNNLFSEILSTLQRERFPEKYFFKSQQQTAAHFYILLRGRVKISRYHPDNGRELTLFLLGPGDSFDVLNLICDGAPHDNHLQFCTLDEVELLSAPVKHWLRWLEQSPALRKASAKMAGSRVEHLKNLASELALDDTRTRLAHLLLRYFDNSSYGLNLINDLPQQELANMIGSVRPVVARLLGELRREGVIDTCNGRLHISNYDQLLSIAEDGLVTTS